MFVFFCKRIFNWTRMIDLYRFNLEDDNIFWMVCDDFNFFKYTCQRNNVNIWSYLKQSDYGSWKGWLEDVLNCKWIIAYFSCIWVKLTILWKEAKIYFERRGGTRHIFCNLFINHRIKLIHSVSPFQDLSVTYWLTDWMAETHPVNSFFNRCSSYVISIGTCAC